jgi:hypothetical protein
MQQKLPKITVVSWTFKELRASYTEFCAFAARVVLKTLNKILGKSKCMKYHKSQWYLDVVCSLE